MTAVHDGEVDLWVVEGPANRANPNLEEVRRYYRDVHGCLSVWDVTIDLWGHAHRSR